MDCSIVMRRQRLVLLIEGRLKGTCRVVHQDGEQVIGSVTETPGERSNLDE